VIISGVILAAIGYMSGLTILQTIGGLLVVVMWGSSSVFFPAATPGLEVAGADFDARPQIRAEPMGRPLSALRRRITARRPRRHSRAAAVGLAAWSRRSVTPVSALLTAPGPRHARLR
jgi:hypothetical protein